MTDRTMFLSAHHMEAHALREGTLGARARRRLSESEDADDLLLISELDHAGRQRGVPVPDVEEAIMFLRELAEGM